MRILLVAGDGSRLAERLADVLAADPAVDAVVRADARSTRLGDQLAASGAGSVVHVTPEPDVLGTMRLLAACQRSETVHRLVVQSSTAVYGTSPRDPAVFTEDMTARDVPHSGPAKDAVETEGYLRGFARRRPDVTVTVLRFAPLLGPAVDTPLARYLTLPVVPVRVGFDPRLQVTHADDAVRVLHVSAVTDRPGVFNVAGDGVLVLSQALRRARRLAVPVPCRDPGALGYGRVVDTTRLRQEFGYSPRFSTAETLAAFLARDAGRG